MFVYSVFVCFGVYVSVIQCGMYAELLGDYNGEMRTPEGTQCLPKASNVFCSCCGGVWNIPINTALVTDTLLCCC